MTNKRRRPVQPLAPPPLHSSRKKARQLTTLFHKYTRERDAAAQSNDVEKIQQMDHLITEMGGRAAYQRASQVSTSFYSTSKWVLGVLARNGWLHGIRTQCQEEKTRKAPRRMTRLLEVGAINTELLDAAAEQQMKSDISGNGDSTLLPVTKYKLHVRAIDLHSMHPGIEQADFLTIPSPAADELDSLYDVIVCSMVLNCVTTPEQRGKMITRLFYFLRPEGLLFLTIPKSCLTLSPYMDRERFSQLLQDVGFEIEDSKDSPKISFFQCRRRCSQNSKPAMVTGEIVTRWSQTKTIHRGKKYRNDFNVILTEENVLPPIGGG